MIIMIMIITIRIRHIGLLETVVLVVLYVNKLKHFLNGFQLLEYNNFIVFLLQLLNFFIRK